MRTVEGTVSFNTQEKKIYNMKKVIRLTESDLTRIVKRTIREMYEDESGEAEWMRPKDWCKRMESAVYELLFVGLIDTDEAMRLMDDSMNTVKKQVEKGNLSDKDYSQISECYDFFLSEVENTEYNKLNENEDEEDENFWDKVKLDFGRPKDFTAILSDISDLISYSEDVNDFKMKLEEFTEDNQEDIDNLTDDERNRLDRFINSVMTRYDFNS